MPKPGIKTSRNSPYVHYGCGLDAPEGWQNFDASPTLRLQRSPFLGAWLGNRLHPRFPKNVKFGNVVFGLPVATGSCKGVYCSHVLEHLALEDFRKALKETYRMLGPGGYFRCVVPDLLFYAKAYVDAAEKKDPLAAHDFVGKRSALGQKTRPRTLSGLIYHFTRTTGHRWMWDEVSLKAELTDAGFTDIRRCSPGDSEDPMFKLVEKASRFERSVALQCRK